VIITMSMSWRRCPLWRSHIATVLCRGRGGIGAHGSSPGAATRQRWRSLGGRGGGRAPSHGRNSRWKTSALERNRRAVAMAKGRRKRKIRVCIGGGFKGGGGGVGGTREDHSTPCACSRPEEDDKQYRAGGLGLARAVGSEEKKRKGGGPPIGWAVR
jgi:hypothetical protein